MNLLDFETAEDAYNNMQSGEDCSWMSAEITTELKLAKLPRTKENGKYTLESVKNGFELKKQWQKRMNAKYNKSSDEDEVKTEVLEETKNIKAYKEENQLSLF